MTYAAFWSLLVVIQLVPCRLHITRNFQPPNYKSEKVTIRAMSTRAFGSQHELFFEAFGKSYQLQLNPVSVLAPDLKVFEADSSGHGGIKLNNLGTVKEQDLGGTLYNIKDAPGSIIFSTGKTGAQVEGFIDDIYVKPSSPTGFTFRENMDKEHVAYKVPLDHNLIDRDPIETGSVNVEMQDMLDIPEEVVVEVLAVMDYKNSQRMNFNKEEITKFLAIEYGAVQRIYDVFKNPTIKFRITKILITKNEDAQPYINDNILNERYVSDKCLDDFITWAYGPKGLPSVDLAFLHMDHRITIVDSGTNAVGLAYVGHACKRGAGIAEDQAPYHLGYLTVAHEIGHLLNSHHDGHSTSPTCPFKKGNLMGSDQYDSLKYIPSECSYERIRQFVISANGSCLRSTSHGLLSAAHVLPADDISNDEICQLKMGPYYYAKLWDPQEGLCSKALYCCNGPDNNNCTWMGGMEVIEGFPCGEGKSCIKGRCVDFVEDYDRMSAPIMQFTKSYEDIESFTDFRNARNFFRQLKFRYK